MRKEHLHGTLADRLCQLGIATIHHLHRDFIPHHATVAHWPDPEVRATLLDLLTALRDVQSDLELDDDALVVDYDTSSRQWVAAQIELEQHGPSRFHDGHIIEHAPASAESAARRLLLEQERAADAYATQWERDEQEAAGGSEIDHTTP
jgi:hypothetical protein